MDFKNKILISVLLLVSFITSNLGKLEESCKETEFARQLLSISENRQFPIKGKDLKKAVIISDSHNDQIFNEFKKKLELVIAPLYMPVKPENFLRDVKKVYETVLILDKAKYIQIIIHTDKIDRIPEVFNDFTNIFDDLSGFENSIALLVTDDVENVHDKVKEKLNQMIYNKTLRKEISNLAQILHKNIDQQHILILNKNFSELTDTIIENIANHSYTVKGERKFKFPIHQQTIECLITDLSEKVMNGMSQIVSKLDKHFRSYDNDLNKIYDISKWSNFMRNFSTLHPTINATKAGASYLKQHAIIVSKPPNKFTLEDKVVGDLNYLWNVSRELNHTKDPEDFFQELDAIYRLLTDTNGRESSYLSQNLYILQFLFIVSSDDDAFASAVKKWSLPLRQFKYSKRDVLSQWYQSRNDGLFLPRNITKLCINMRKGTKLQIKGEKVRLTDVDLESCKSEVRFIEIFSLKTVLINTDLNLVGKALQVAIIAPTWQVLGNRIINLNGTDGKPFTIVKAKDGSKDGNKRGRNGLAGLPGSPAGSFYGISNRIINRENLFIFANGGSGGPGQHGGDGVQGDEGETYKNDPKLSCSNRTKNCTIDGWRAEKINSKTVSRLSSPRVSISVTRETYQVFGTKGGRGGRGGNGGIGGIGGKGGNIIMYERDNLEKMSPIIPTANGKEGLGGKGGKGGLGGKNGKFKKVECERGQKAYIYEAIEDNSDPGYASDRNGEDGKVGTSLRRRNQPMNSIIAQNFPSTVNEYKLYARLYLADPDFKGKHVLFQFYNLLSVSEIADTYDTLSLVEEFTGLELQYFKLKKQVNLTSSYQSLRKRIQNYAKKLNETAESSEEYKRIIRDMDRDIADKIRNSYLNRQYPVISDIISQFTTLGQKPMQILQDQEQVDTITDWLDQHRAPLNDKIEEAQNMISGVIQSAVSDLENTLDEEIDALLTEFIYIRNEAKKNNTDKLNKQREELQNTIFLKTMFGIVKGACGALGLIHPALGVVGTVASSAISIIDTSVTESDISTAAPVIPKAIEAISTETEKYIKEDKDKQKKVIEQQKNYLETLKKDASADGIAVIDEVWKSTNDLREASHPTISIKSKTLAMQATYAEAEKKFEEKSQDSKNVEESKVHKLGQKAAKYLKATSQALQTASDTIVKVMKDETKINEISKAIKASEQKYQQLQAFEEKIYNSTQPMLDNMMEDLGLTGQKMSNLNENNLLLTKWNVSNTITNMQKIMENMTSGFKVNEDIKFTLDKINKAFDIMNQMNEQVLKYKDEKAKMTFAAGLHIAHNSNLMISDTRLRRALSRLQVALTYNAVSEAYDEWISAFKQFSFPNAGLILESFEWPDIFVNNNITFIIHDIERNVIELDKHLHHQRKFDAIVKNKARQNFMGSTSRTNEAFYVWRKEKYNQKINDLLSGKKVELVADVNFQQNLSAVKFNHLEVIFTSKNASIQQELNDNLVSFRVNLVHEGDSKYKCHSSVYEIKNTPTFLRYSFLKDSDNVPNFQTESYLKLSKGEFMLSPYATWLIQLTTKKRENFEMLEKFKNEVDLELIGHGQFLEGPIVECRDDVEKYYKKID